VPERDRGGFQHALPWTGTILVHKRQFSTRVSYNFLNRVCR
jgi:hypothetical protein